LHLSASYASGFRQFLSQPHDEFQDYLNNLNLAEPESTIMRDIFSDILSIQTLEDLCQRMDYFWDILATEHLEFDTILSLKEEISLSVSQLSSIHDLPGRQGIASSFHTLIQLIQPLDIMYMASLIENFESAKIIMENKDLILFLGNSGAGKSTTIHFLAGSKLKKVKHNGFSHIEPIDSAPCARDVIVAASTQSVTKSMTVVELPNGMILCDTPGFGDTSGPETDIANGMGLINSLSRARSVKPVIVLSEKNMDRLRAVREMKNAMSSMFVDIQSLLPSMSYFFTKYDADDADSIWQQITALREEFSEDDKFDANYVAIVDDMIKKTNPLATIIDPLQKSKESLSADKILDDINVLAPSGESLSQLLKTFVSPESENRLSNHWRVLQKQITLALKAGDIGFLSKPFSEMKLLSKLRIDMHRPTFEDSVNQLETYAMNQYIHAKEIFSSFFHRFEEQYLFLSLQIFKDLLILHPLLLDLSSNSDYATLIHNLILDSLQGLIKTQDYLSDSIDRRLKLFVQVHNGVKREFYVLDEDHTLQPFRQFQNSSISLELLNEILACYDNACSNYLDESMKLLERTNNMISLLSPPNLFIGSVKMLDTATKILSIHLRIDELLEKKDKMMSDFLAFLRDAAYLSITYLYPDQTTIAQKMIPCISQFCSYLRAVQDIPEIDDYFDDGLRRIKDIESDFLNTASLQFSKLHDDCQSHLEMQHPEYEFVAYYTHHLNEIIEKVPMLVEITNRVLRSITDILNQDQLRRVSMFSHGISKLYSDQPRELHINSLRDCLQLLFDAERTFPHLIGFSKSLELIEKTVKERLKLITEGQNFDLDHIRMLLTNLHFAEDLHVVTASPSITFSEHTVLRDQTIKHIQTIFSSMFEDIGFVSLSQFRVMTLLVDALNQFRISTPGEAYNALDIIIDQMKEFGEMIVALTEDRMEIAFSFISSRWKPDGTMSPPNESFPEHLSQFHGILSDFHEFLQQSNKLPLGLSRDLLFVIPDKLYQKWIAGSKSKINQHIQEISNYFEHLNKLDHQVQFASAHMIYQLSLLSKDMSALDRYVTGPTDYFTLNKISIDLLKRCSTEMLTFVRKELEGNNFQLLRDSLLLIRSNPLEEIKKKFSGLDAMVGDRAKKKCQHLQSLIRQIPRTQNEETQLMNFKEILIFGKQLKSFLEFLGDFLGAESTNMLTSSLNQIPVLIDEHLAIRITGTKSLMSVNRYSDCVKQLTSLSLLLDTIVSESEYLHLDLHQKIGQKDEIQRTLHENMSAEVSRYSTLHPQEYPPSPSLSILVKQLQQARGQDSESLLHTLTDNVLNKLNDILSNVKNNQRNIFHCEAEISHVNVALKCLPQDKTQSIHEFSRVCSIAIQETKSQFQRRIKENEDAKSFDHLLKLFQSSCDRNYPFEIKEISKSLEYFISVECSKFRDDIKRNDTVA
jgi:GTP-binding protein EngB required for normal cell division